MNTRDFILIGAGVLVGHILVGILNRDKISMEMEQVAQALDDSLPQTSPSQTLPPAPPATTGSTTAGTTQIKEPEVTETQTDPRIAFCNENWAKYSMTRRFGSEEEAQKVYDDFIENCLSTMPR
jgi:hypothetical protein